MARKMVYCVQGFIRAGRELTPRAQRHYDSEEAAIVDARRLSERVAGVLVFSIEGDPKHDLWSEPTLIRKYGSVPRTELT